MKTSFTWNTRAFLFWALPNWLAYLAAICWLEPFNQLHWLAKLVLGIGGAPLLAFLMMFVAMWPAPFIKWNYGIRGITATALIEWVIAMIVLVLMSRFLGPHTWFTWNHAWASLSIAVMGYPLLSLALSGNIEDEPVTLGDKS